MVMRVVTVHGSQRWTVDNEGGKQWTSVTDKSVSGLVETSDWQKDNTRNGARSSTG